MQTPFSSIGNVNCDNEHTFCQIKSCNFHCISYLKASAVSVKYKPSQLVNSSLSARFVDRENSFGSKSCQKTMKGVYLSLCTFLVLIWLSVQQQMGYYGYIFQSCPFVSDIAGTLKRRSSIFGCFRNKCFTFFTLSDPNNVLMLNSLQYSIAGQDAGVKSILDAITIWESNKKYGPSGPLVLAIVGQNGVGKSETGDTLIYCNIVYLMRNV